MSQPPDHTVARRPSTPAAGQRSAQENAAGAVEEARPRRHWWGVVADALARAEQRIVAGFRVPPNGG